MQQPESHNFLIIKFLFKWFSLSLFRMHAVVEYQKERHKDNYHNGYGDNSTILTHITHITLCKECNLKPKPCVQYT
jgi:hypothetical protein